MYLAKKRLAGFLKDLTTKMVDTDVVAMAESP
jgi:hypothetical protein